MWPDVRFTGRETKSSAAGLEFSSRPGHCPASYYGTACAMEQEQPMNPRPCIIITGGANGIGRTLVSHFTALGWSVGVIDRDASGCAVLQAEDPGCGQVLAISADVGVEAEVARAVSGIAEHFGRVDALINNAGGACAGPDIAEWTLERWMDGLGMNLTGVFLCVKHAVSHLRKSGGNIVNIASTRALQSEPNTFAYSAAKGGVVALTHSLAASLGPRIRVNCISPGWIETRSGACHSDSDRRQHPCGRVGMPADIAALAEFLLDNCRSGFIDGQNICVDGGMTVKMIYAE